jgi:hypothetical protein
MAVYESNTSRLFSVMNSLEKASLSATADRSYLLESSFWPSRQLMSFITCVMCIKKAFATKAGSVAPFPG